ncbi:MAG: hypothetical protein V9E81_05175 [Marmoricola sp.]
MVDIEANITRFMGTRGPTLRYTSFDYCFNYFQSHRTDPAQLLAPGKLDFYDANADVLDGLHIPTVDFVSGQPTDLVYPKAKLIDMVFFIEGY